MKRLIIFLSMCIFFIACNVSNEKDEFFTQGEKRGIHKITRTKYNKSGYDMYGYDRAGYDKDKLDINGYDQEGFKNGFNQYGYDKEGYDRKGYDIFGYDRNNYNKDGKIKNIINDIKKDSLEYKFREKFVKRKDTVVVLTMKEFSVFKDFPTKFRHTTKEKFEPIEEFKIRRKKILLDYLKEIERAYCRIYSNNLEIDYNFNKKQVEFLIFPINKIGKRRDSFNEIVNYELNISLPFNDVEKSKIELKEKFNGKEIRVELLVSPVFHIISGDNFYFDSKLEKEIHNYNIIGYKIYSIDKVYFEKHPDFELFEAFYAYVDFMLDKEYQFQKIDIYKLDNKLYFFNKNSFYEYDFIEKKIKLYENSNKNTNYNLSDLKSKIIKEGLKL